jgi:hypothetical protein
LRFCGTLAKVRHDMRAAIQSATESGLRNGKSHSVFILFEKRVFLRCFNGFFNSPLKLTP